MNKISMDKLVVLDQKSIPVVFPPEMEVNETAFYEQILETITKYQLPVVCENVILESAQDPAAQEQLLISPNPGDATCLRVLVALQRVGLIGHIERKSIWLMPDLSRELALVFDGLPPRLTPDSPELPAKQPFASASAPNSPFKNEAHKQRVMMIEERRRQRYDMIIARQQERAPLRAKWLAEISDSSGSNLAAHYLKDSIDLVVNHVVSALKAQGVEAQDADEVIRAQEQVKAEAERIRRNF